MQIKITYILVSLGLLISGAMLTACNDNGGRAAIEQSEYKQLALNFTNTLAERHFAQAYAMTAATYKKQFSQTQLQAEFERIVPSDFGPIGPIEIGQGMTTWADKARADVAWFYVSIGGESYSEGLSLVISLENDRPVISKIEFGRP